MSVNWQMVVSVAIGFVLGEGFIWCVNRLLHK